MKAEVFFYATIVTLAALFVISFIADTVRYPKRRRQAGVKFYELLLKGIKQGTIEEESIYLMYERFNENVYSFFFPNIVSYERFLESFLLYVREKDEDGTLTKDVTNILKPILEKIKVENPYTNVNEGQRRILLSIEDTMKKSSTITDSERAAIRHNLNELAIAIEEKQKKLHQSERLNKWTVPVSIAGVIATIVFGVIQLFQH